MHAKQKSNLMKEEFLHHIWRFKLFRFQDAKTLSGKTIDIEKVGVSNPNAGPDFLEAHLKIDQLRWYGSVEIHVKSSDWLHHNHNKDPNYHTLILHVVYEQDVHLTLLEELGIETLELKNLIDPKTLEAYHRLTTETYFLPCYSLVNRVEEEKISLWKNQLLLDRMLMKSNKLLSELEKAQHNWEAVLFRQLAYTFGLKVNAEIFLQWSVSFPFSVLQKVQYNREAITALFFGQAGLLEDLRQDDYQKNLSEKYQFLRVKYHLQPMSHHLFRYFRMRPISFPTIRIAQLAALYGMHKNLFSVLMSAQSKEEIIVVFQSIEVDMYWENHYRFGEESIKMSKKISSSKIENIILNTLLPLRFAYAFYRDEEVDERWLSMYEEIKAEKNNITNLYEKAGLKNKNAYDSQAFLQAYEHFCLPKKCLNCSIGYEVLKPYVG